MSEMSDLTAGTKVMQLEAEEPVGSDMEQPTQYFFNMVTSGIFSTHHWYNNFDLSQHSQNSFKFIIRLRDFLSKVDLCHTHSFLLLPVFSSDSAKASW